LLMTIIPLTMIGTDRSMGEVLKLIRDPFLYVQAEFSRETQLFTQLRVLLTYVRLLFLPIHQNLDYDYPLYHSFFIPQVFLSFLFHLSALGLALYLFYRSRSAAPNLRLIAFGILWFYVTLAIESSIISIVIVIFEYRVYLPSVGWVMAITSSVWIALEKLKPRFPGLEKKAILVFAAIVILFSVLTYTRNEVWRDEIKMWQDVVTKSPNKSRGHFKLGLFLGKRGRYDEAIREFQTALKLEPNQARVHNNLALIYGAQGKLDDAIKEYQIALAIDPKDVVVHYNLGVLFGGIQRFEDAVREFHITLKLNPLDANAHNSLGVIFARQGRLDEAVEEFKTALEIEPGHINARNNLAKIYKGD